MSKVTCTMDLTPAQMIQVGIALGGIPEASGFEGFVSELSTTEFEPPAATTVGLDQSSRRVEVEIPVTTDPVEPDTLVTEVDIRGVPWDARIHSSTKTKTKNGVWSRRKNVDDTTFDTIEAALLAGVGGGQDTLPPPPPEPTPVASNVFTLAPTQTEVPPPPPPAQPVTGETVASAITTFSQLMVATNANGIAPAQVRTAVEQVGLENIPALVGRQDLVPAVAAILGLG